MTPHVDLMEVHGALSSLCFAVKQALEPHNVRVSATWNNDVYLVVEIECYARIGQRVIDQLRHGVRFLPGYKNPDV